MCQQFRSGLVTKTSKPPCGTSSFCRNTCRNRPKNWHPIWRSIPCSKRKNDTRNGTILAQRRFHQSNRSTKTKVYPTQSQNKNGGRRWESNPPGKIFQHASSVLKTVAGTRQTTPATNILTLSFVIFEKKSHFRFVGKVTRNTSTQFNPSSKHHRSSEAEYTQRAPPCFHDLHVREEESRDRDFDDVQAWLG